MGGGDAGDGRGEGLVMGGGGTGDGRGEGLVMGGGGTGDGKGGGVGNGRGCLPKSKKIQYLPLKCTCTTLYKAHQQPYIKHTCKNMNNLYKAHQQPYIKHTNNPI